MNRAAFDALRGVLSRYATQLTVQVDTPLGYTLATKSPSPHPQHKGEPMFFGGVRFGKAYVSFYLMPLYVCDELTSQVSPVLKKRMQGKTCFNFKVEPDAEQLARLNELTKASIEFWAEKKWL